MAHEKHLTFTSNGFRIKNDTYRFEDVTEIAFGYLVTQKRTNFIKAGEDHSVEVHIYTRHNPKPIIIKSNGIMSLKGIHGFNTGKKATNSLIEKYKELANETRTYRAEKYISSLDEKGYFVYDNKKFHINGDIFAEKWQANILTTSPWVRDGSNLIHTVKKPGFFKSGVGYSINTSHDGDIFESLLSFIAEQNSAQ